MKKAYWLLCVTAVLSFASRAQQQDAVVAGKKIAVVETTNGKIRGYIHNDIYTYKGIPYAQAERFMVPAKPVPWPGIRSTLTYGPICPTDGQWTTENDAIEFPFQHVRWYMNEHCQVLNVWTAGINDGRKRPVMVWIHGGGLF